MIQDLRFKNKRGFTMVELLVVVAIVAILIILAMFSWRSQVAKARDAKRKDDINKIKIAYENYYNDHECYPPSTVLSNCRSQDLMPYLAMVPCDPQTNQPYEYEVESDCTGFQVKAEMEMEPCLVVAVGTDRTMQCVLATPTPSSTSAPTTTPTPTGEPEPTGGVYACDPKGQCNVYSDPVEAGCPHTYNDAVECQNACDASSGNWCKK